MGAGVEIDYAERLIDLFHEIGRCEAAIAILFVTRTPIGSLGSTPPYLGRKHFQQAQQACDRTASSLQTGDGRARQTRS